MANWPWVPAFLHYSPLQTYFPLELIWNIFFLSIFLVVHININAHSLSCIQIESYYLPIFWNFLGGASLLAHTSTAVQNSYTEWRHHRSFNHKPLHLNLGCSGTALDTGKAKNSLYNSVHFYVLPPPWSHRPSRMFAGQGHTCVHFKVPGSSALVFH